MNNDSTIIIIIIFLFCFPGCHRGQWSRWKILHDSEILSRSLHKKLQENDRGGFPGKTDEVSDITEGPKNGIPI